MDKYIAMGETPAIYLQQTITTDCDYFVNKLNMRSHNVGLSTPKTSIGL